METIICSTCKQSRPLEDFIRSQRDSETGNIYQFQRKKCITCVGKRGKERLIERFGKEGAIKYNKMDKLRRRCRDFYKIDHNVVLQMLIDQNNQCPICQKPIEFLTLQYENEACVDHDHQTGRVRGIVCHWCNTGMGYFQDSTKRLENCIAYLKRVEG